MGGNQTSKKLPGSDPHSPDPYFVDLAPPRAIREDR